MVGSQLCLVVALLYNVYKITVTHQHDCLLILKVNTSIIRAVFNKEDREVWMMYRFPVMKNPSVLVLTVS